MKSAAVDTKRTTKKQDATRADELKLSVVETPPKGMTFLKPGCRAWAEAWKGLLQLAGCVVSRNTDTSDRWEYVGTYQGQHEFRHKSHPQAGERLYARVSTGSCGAGAAERQRSSTSDVRSGLGEAIIWSGTPYYEEGSEVSLKKECPLKALFSTGDG